MYPRDIPIEGEDSIARNLPDRVHEDFSDRSTRYADDPPPRFQPRPPPPDRHFHWGPLAAAAGAGFLIALFGPCRSTDPLGDQELAKAQSELQTTRDRAAQLESQLSSTRESDEPVAAEPEPKAEQKAEQPAPPPPTPKHRSRSEVTPEEVLRQDEKSEPAPEPAPPAESEPTATAPPIPESLPKLALAEPAQVAAESTYATPDSAGPTVRSTSQSGTPDLAVLHALAPEKAGWTTEAQPTLYWHASAGTMFPAEFKLVREGSDQPLVRVQLPAPVAAGIQRIELSQFGVALDEGASYRWSVSFVDLEGSGEDRATGGIRRVAAPEALRVVSDSISGSELLDALERAGLWYDALDLVTRSIDRNPGAENLVARRNAMLARVGIELPSA